MAYVVDPNSWRMIPLSDSQHPLRPTSSNAPASGRGDSPDAPAAGTSEANLAITQLSAALASTFDQGHDQVVWNLAPGASWQQALGDAQLRVDAQHGPPRAAIPATSPTGSDVSTPMPWLVVVENLRELTAPERCEALQGALGDPAQLLLVACDVDRSRTADLPPESIDSAGAVAAAERLGYQYVGPIPVDDPDQLAAALAAIRRLGQSTILHLDARGALPPPHFAPRPERGAVVPDWAPPRELVIATLAELAPQDERIVVVSTDVDPALDAAWQNLPGRLFSVDSGVPYALAWCASLASGGSRPFAVLSALEAQDSLGQIRREICLAGAPVTLIVESSRDELTGGSGSSCLAGLVQLPHLAVLAPKDAAELRQMLAWCASQNDPAVVFLGSRFDPEISWPATADIKRGRSERIGQGSDVAIVAWGPLTAAATIAASSLAQSGIEASVVNARFAQPLDVEALVAAARESTYLVLLDDAPQHGGFAGWVLERLLRQGVTQPVTIVAPPAPDDRDEPHDHFNHCAQAIVERCRWLADPASTPREALEGPDIPIVVQDRAVAADWFSPPRLDSADERDLPRQILTQQFSPFIERWVAEYEKVGSRDVYLWRWCLHGLGLISLSCVAPKLRQEMRETKLLSVMYGVMLDDVADQGGADDFLNELKKIIAGQPDRDFSRFSNQQQRYARFTVDLWNAFESRLRTSPCFGEYEELLAYDHRQLLNTFSYSSMVNQRPALLNLPEHDMYMPHNMQMMSFATMDLMCSPNFDRDELGKLREVVWHAQCMGRIGNLVSTWQREIDDRDFTSGVFARALRQGDLTPGELSSLPPEVIERAIRGGGHERYFLRKWEAHRQCIEALAPHVHSVDVGQQLSGLERLIHMELSSRGYK